MSEIIIDIINKKRCLQQVIELGDTYSKSLGFFPYQAFVRSADEKMILTAVNGSGECVGYLLYRIAKEQERAAIVHLCISEQYRGKGIAGKLVNYLTQRVKHLRGISLRCRKDYEANSLWPKLGFISTNEIAGRARKGSTLVCWWMELNNSTLFSYAAAEKFESKTCVAIDTNILIDLLQPTNEISTPSHALFASWIEDIEFCLTKETDNEIQRQDDSVIKAASKKKAADFHLLPGDTPTFIALCGEIRALWPKEISESDQSDLRQIAWAIIAEVPFFVTRDNMLINRISDNVENQYGLKILHPTDLILHLDELKSAKKYQPARFIETTLDIRSITNEDMKTIAVDFQNSELERKKDFLNLVRSYLVLPKMYDCSIVTDNNKPLSLIVTSFSSESHNELKVPMLRVAYGKLTSTIAYQMVNQCLYQACSLNSLLVKITDPYLTNVVKNALFHFGFIEALDGWTKICMRGASPANEIADKMLSIADQIDVEYEGVDEWAMMLRETSNLTDTDFVLSQEHYLWPAKISDADIPAIIISIRPHWAEELFDRGLAKQGLFGRKQDLALNVESVYYCSPNKNLPYPGRILWYVSKKSGVDGSGYLRACSRLDAIDIDTPKELYRKYKRLGIYQWNDVYQTAKNDLERKIMALNFSATELFDAPVSWNEMQEVLANAGIISQIQRPQPITNDVFLNLYNKGTKATKG